MDQAHVAYHCYAYEDAASPKVYTVFCHHNVSFLVRDMTIFFRLAMLVHPSSHDDKKICAGKRKSWYLEASSSSLQSNTNDLRSRDKILLERTQVLSLLLGGLVGTVTELG